MPASDRRLATVCKALLSLRPNSLPLSRAGRAMVLLVALFLCERAQALVRATSILDPDYHLDPPASMWGQGTQGPALRPLAHGGRADFRNTWTCTTTSLSTLGLSVKQCTHGRGALLAPRRQAPGERHLHDREVHITALVFGGDPTTCKNGCTPGARVSYFTPPGTQRYVPYALIFAYINFSAHTRWWGKRGAQPSRDSTSTYERGSHRHSTRHRHGTGTATLTNDTSTPVRKRHYTTNAPLCWRGEYTTERGNRFVVLYEYRDVVLKRGWTRAARRLTPRFLGCAGSMAASLALRGEGGRGS